MIKWDINWTMLCADVVAFACDLSLCGVSCLRLVIRAKIMPPRMRTQSDGRLVVESRGGGTGKRVGSGGRGRGPRGGNHECVDELNGQGNDQGENVRNVLGNKNRVGCSYKEFLACNPKEYDGKGGVVVLTRWIEKIESVQDMSGCSIDQKVKYTVGSFVEEFCPSHEIQKLETELCNHVMVGAGHAAYTNRFHELARLVSHLVTLKSRKIKRYVNGSIKKVEKRGNVWEPSKDKNGRDDNKRTRTGNAFATTSNPVGRENTGAWPKCTTYNSYLAPRGPSRICFSCNRPGMDWLSNHKAEIVCHKKVVRIPLIDGRVLKVLEERPEEKARLLMSDKARDKKQEEIVVIKLVPGTVRITKSPYRLAPSEMEELSVNSRNYMTKVSFDQVHRLGEHRHVIDGNRIYVDPSKIEAVRIGKPLELRLSDYDCEIHYHPGKVNVVVDALSRKERVKPKRVRALNITLQSSINDKILATQKEAVDESARLQKGLDEMTEQKSGGSLYYLDRIWERIAMDFMTKLFMTSSGHDIIWVIMDRLTKSAQFLPMHKDYKMDRLYLNEMVARHGVPISIISDRDSRFTSRFWQSMQEALGTRLDMSTAYHPQTDGQSKRTIQTLKDMLSACAEVGEGQLIGPELYRRPLRRSLRLRTGLRLHMIKGVVHFGKKGKLAPRFVGPFEITEQIDLVAYRLRLFEELNGVHDTFHVSNLKKCLAKSVIRQLCGLRLEKSYADKKRKPLEFCVGEFVLLKVSPWKGVVRFGKKGNLAPRFFGPFEITERIGPVAYRLRLPEEMNDVHDTFHVSNLKKCLADPTLQVPLDEI
nr:reverse transcriptase domain-containing protein [Tanacetum cinerariifolium]